MEEADALLCSLICSNKESILEEIDKSVQLKEYLNTSGSLVRLAELLITGLTHTETQVDVKKFHKLFQRCKLVVPDGLCHLFQTIDLCLCQNPKICLTTQRNVCLVLYIILSKYVVLVDQQRCELICHYLLTILRKCDHMEAVLYAVLSIECVLLKKVQILDNFDLINLLLEEFETLERFIHHRPTDVPLYSPRMVPFRYQVGLCVSWCLKHFLNPWNMIALEQLPPVKLDPDGFSARCDLLDLFPPVLSACSITSGVWYYEVTLLTTGEMRIGWTTRESPFGPESILGSNEHSIGFDGINIWNDGEKYPVETPIEPWKPGDIVGCLIDVPNKQFLFYFNGDKLLFKLGLFKKISFSSQPYFAAASISSHQQIYFNFGQSSFVHPPEIEFCNIYSQADKHSQLQKTDFANGFYWFKAEVINNRITPHFQDQTQVEFDQLVMDLECGEKYNMKLLETLKENHPDFCLRLIQSCIRMLGVAILDDESRHDILLQKLWWILNQIDLPKLANFLELVYPYMQLQAIHEEDVIKQRNVCLVLSIFGQKYQIQKLSILTLEILQFLFEIIFKSEDLTSLLFAIIILNNFWIPKKTDRMRLIKLEKALLQIPNYEYKNFDIDCMQIQLDFTAQWCLNHLFYEFNKSDIIQTWTLNPGWRSSDQLKLSLDLLSVRNDSPELAWIRSGFAVNSGVYYYEALLVTNGQMDFGWETKQDPEQWAVRIHTWSKCLEFGRTKYQLPDFSWKSGDVIGCLINIPQKCFQFYLNGAQLIDKHVQIPFNSNSPYFATISLGLHQQCWLNFGQVAFRFPPEKYQDFYHTANDKEMCQFCAERPGTMKYITCEHWNFCMSCLDRLKHCPTCCK